MSTRSMGQVLERSGSHGRVYAPRFQAYGQRRVQLGHTDPGFSLCVYTRMMRRDPGERERLRALGRNQVNGGWSRRHSIASAPTPVTARAEG